MYCTVPVSCMVGLICMVLGFIHFAGGKGVPAEQMAKTMIEAFQDFIKSPKYKGSLRTIHIVIFDRKMLETFVAVIKTALDPQQKKGFCMQINTLMVIKYVLTNFLKYFFQLPEQQ